MEATIKIARNKIYHQDNLELLRHVQDECIDLTVTSPPYDDIRDYEHHTWDFKKLAKELFRVTKTGGMVCWVVQDKIHDWSRSGTSFKQALYFMEIGFKLVDTIIYAKKSTLNNRFHFYNSSFEYIFVMSKDNPKTINLIRDVKNQSSGERRYPKAKNRRNKAGVTAKDTELKTISPYAKRGNIWHYSVGYNTTTKDTYAFEHPALMPEALAADLIESFSNEGDLVFDPFLGSGTTAKVAKAMNRDYIGTEIAGSYYQIAQKRLSQQTIFKQP